MVSRGVVEEGGFLGVERVGFRGPPPYGVSVSRYRLLFSTYALENGKVDNDMRIHEVSRRKRLLYSS